MSKEHSKPIYINELYASLNTKKRADTCGNSVTNLSCVHPFDLSVSHRSLYYPLRNFFNNLIIGSYFFFLGPIIYQINFKINSDSSID